jgi:o-succinylbenzoate synthase
LRACAPCTPHALRLDSGVSAAPGNPPSRLADGFAGGPAPRVAAVRLRPYRLRLVRPWIAAAATITERAGTLLAVTLDDGVTGWGDCAPLPSSGAEGHRRASDALAALARAGVGASVDVQLGRLDRIACAEARWALETALLDAQARRLGVPLHRLLGGAPAPGVPVNAALGPLDANCAHRARDALMRGFRIGKIKVGVAPPEVEAPRLRALADETRGRLRLRLDANRAWDADTAQRFLAAASALPIDGVEEPLAAPTIDALQRLQSRLPFPIAVDESLRALGAAALIASRAVRRWVVKPARLGGLATVLRLAEKAHAAGIEIVLTSVVDSTIGVAAAAHLAAALPRAATHGLGTLEWLAEDVAAAPPVEAGVLRFVPGPGLGVVPFAGTA